MASQNAIQNTIKSSSMIDMTNKKRKVSFSPFNMILFIFLVLYCLSFIVLLVWALSTALKTPDQYYDSVLSFPPGSINKWAWGNFSYVMKNFSVPVMQSGKRVEISFAMMILYTFLYTVPSAVIAAFVPCLMAYLCARYNYVLSKIVYSIVIVTMILPIVGNYPAEIQLLKTLHLFDTYAGAWLQKANFLGMYFLVFFAMFKGMPDDFAEAARIDGANEYKIFFRIMLPIVRTTLLTVGLIRFIEFWNDYQIPLIYLPSKPTLAYGLYWVTNYPSKGLSSAPMRMAGTFLVILPILILFLIFRNKIMGNLTVGGLKG